MTPSTWALSRKGHAPVQVEPNRWVCARCGMGARWTGRRWTGTLAGLESTCFPIEGEKTVEV